MDADAAGEPHQIVNHGAMQKLEPARPRRLADDDLGDVLGLRVRQNVFGDLLAARQGERLAAEPFGQSQGIGEPIALDLRQLGGARRLDRERGPGGVQPVREALGVTHQASGARVLADADQHPLARGPGAGDGVGLHVGEELGVDPLRRAAEREFPQRGEIAGGEVVGERAAGGLADIDLAVLEALDQVVGGDVDDLDVVGAIDDRVGHGLADADAGDLGDDVVEALDVLDVDGGVDVDAGGQQLLHVEVALGVAAFGGVGVGEFVDEDEFRVAGEDGVEIHLLEHPTLVVDLAPRDHLEAAHQRSGLGAAVGLDDADHDVDAVFPLGLRRDQHLVGLADAGRGAEEDLQPAAGLAQRFLEERIGRGALVRFRHGRPPAADAA